MDLNKRIAKEFKELIEKYGDEEAGTITTGILNKIIEDLDNGNEG